MSGRAVAPQRVARCMLCGHAQGCPGLAATPTWCKAARSGGAVGPGADSQGIAAAVLGLCGWQQGQVRDAGCGVWERGQEGAWSRGRTAHQQLSGLGEIRRWQTATSPAHQQHRRGVPQADAAAPVQAGRQKGLEGTYIKGGERGGRRVCCRLPCTSRQRCARLLPPSAAFDKRKSYCPPRAKCMHAPFLPASLGWVPGATHLPSPPPASPPAGQAPIPARRPARTRASADAAGWCTLPPGPPGWAQAPPGSARTPARPGCRPAGAAPGSARTAPLGRSGCGPSAAGSSGWRGGRDVRKGVQEETGQGSKVVLSTQ